MAHRDEDLIVTSDFRLPETGEAWMEVEFEAAFQAHYPEVYRLLYRMVGTQQEAEDLAQETFMRLYHYRFRNGQEHNLRAWLCRVAANLARNQFRSASRRQHRETLAERQQGSEASAFNPADVAERRDECERVRSVLRALPERQAQLLLLRHAGLSYRELAAAASEAPGSVGTLLARAHAAFETAYQTFGKEEGGGDEL